MSVLVNKYEDKKMKCKILRADFSQRAKDLYYMVKYDLRLDREYKRQEERIARMIEYSNLRYQ